MQEPTQPSSSSAGRRPRFKTRQPGSDSFALPEETRAHEPPDLSDQLSMPESEAPAAPAAPEPAAPAAVDPGADLPVLPRESRPPGRLLLNLEPSPAAASSYESGSYAERMEEPIPTLSLPNVPPWAKQESAPGGRRSRNGRYLAAAAALLALGLVGGYAIRGVLSQSAHLEQMRAAGGVGARPAVPPEHLTPASQAALDAAFGLVRAGKPQEARAQFAELIKQYPGWPSLALEQVRAALFQGDGTGARALLDAGERSGKIEPVDVAFFNALLQLRAGNYAGADLSLAQAASLDPARSDIYYYWGNCLRKLGKPVEAADSFRSALVRNQVEANEGLYQLKLWLAEIEANAEAASGSAAEIDANLANVNPSPYVLAAAAARDVRAQRFKPAADHLRQAAEFMDGPVFQVVLNDPTFAPEGWRPELKEFYPQGKIAAPPSGSPAPPPAGASAPPPLASPAASPPPPLLKTSPAPSPGVQAPAFR